MALRFVLVHLLLTINLFPSSNADNVGRGLGIQSLELNQYVNDLMDTSRNFLPWAIVEGYEPYELNDARYIRLENVLFDVLMTLVDTKVKGVITTLDWSTLGGFRSSLTEGSFHAQFYNRGELSGFYWSDGQVASTSFYNLGSWEANCTTSGVVEAKFVIQDGFIRLQNLTTSPAYTGACFGDFANFFENTVIPSALQDEVIKGLQSEITFEIGIQELLLTAMFKYLEPRLMAIPLFEIVGNSTRHQSIK